MSPELVTRLPAESFLSKIRIPFHPYPLFGFTTKGGSRESKSSLVTSSCFFITASVFGTDIFFSVRNCFVLSLESASFLAIAKFAHFTYVRFLAFCPSIP